MLAGKDSELKTIVSKLRNSLDSIQSVMLLSYDGLAIVSTLDSGKLKERISALAAGIDSLAEQFLEDAEGGHFSNVFITGPQSYIILRDVGGMAILAVMTKVNVDWVVLQSRINWALSAICALTE